MKIEDLSLAEIVTAKPAAAFNSYNLTELIDHIVNYHHQYVKDNMPVIQQHLKKVVIKHGDSYPYMKKIEKNFDEVCKDFSQHLMKEELILFPKIRRIDPSTNSSNSISTIINIMEIEHQDAGQMMDEIKKLSNNYIVPQNVCVTFRLCLNP